MMDFLERLTVALACGFKENFGHMTPFVYFVTLSSNLIFSMKKMTRI